MYKFDDPDPHIRSGETVPPHLVDAVDRLARFARIMDTAVRIPGTRRQIGLDAAIGLIPLAGDLFTAAYATWIVAQSARLGVPKRKLARMLANVLIDAGIGIVPVAGDVFDVYFKANSRNLEILRDHLRAG